MNITEIYIIIENDRGMGQSMVKAFQDKEIAFKALSSNEYVESVDIACDSEDLKNVSGVWVVYEDDSELGIVTVAAYLTEAEANKISRDDYEYIEMGVN